MHNIRYGDIVIVHVYDKNRFKGYLSCKPGRPLDFATTAYDHDKIMKFCVTPFRFFAEDVHRQTQLVRNEPFVLQQLTTIPGYSGCGRRNKLVSHKGKLCLIETDVYNQTHQGTRMHMELSSNNRFKFQIGDGYVHCGDGLFMDIKGRCEGALEYELQVVSSTDPIRFGQSQVYRPRSKAGVRSHFDPRSCNIKCDSKVKC